MRHTVEANVSKQWSCFTNFTTVGQVLAKDVFQVYGIGVDDDVAFNKKIRRAQFSKFFADLPPCLVGMEARGSSRYWSREISNLEHDLKLMPAFYVKPYVKRGKTDAVDAKAICDAVTRPTMRFVKIKEPDQQSLLVLHRDRRFIAKQHT